jgi:pimeloyl-ACP methyl ester carboxylesterase
MGGWISLLMAKRMPEKLAGLVTIAAAPDFHRGRDVGRLVRGAARNADGGGATGPAVGLWRGHDRHAKLIEDGRNQLVLREPLEIAVPVRMLQGTADADVPMAVAMRLLEHLEGPDIRLELVKGADHRFSDPACLDTITRALEEVLAHG